MSNVLKDLIASENDARDFGFDWPNQQMIIEWIISECHEVLDALKQQESASRVQEEIGDIFHSAISLCLFSGFDVEQTLKNSTDKFTKRMQHLKAISRARGLTDLNGQNIEFMLELWKEAKKASA